MRMTGECKGTNQEPPILVAKGYGTLYSTHSINTYSLHPLVMLPCAATSMTSAGSGRGCISSKNFFLEIMPVFCNFLQTEAFSSCYYIFFKLSSYSMHFLQNFLPSLWTIKFFAVLLQNISLSQCNFFNLYSNKVSSSYYGVFLR